MNSILNHYILIHRLALPITLAYNMTERKDYILDGFNKIDRDLRHLMLCFREVLEELGENQIASCLPWLEETSSFPLPQLLSGSGLEQAYSIAFQLLNIVEANAAAKTRRLRESNSGLIAERGLWGEQLLRLKNLGHTEKEIAAFLPSVHVEPVFTAHPTEAKRSAVLAEHRILYQLLARADKESLTPSEQKKSRHQIKICLEKLWRSGEIFFTQPTVAEERRDILFYLRDIIPDAVTSLDERLRWAWEDVGFSPTLLAKAYPQISFGTWVGGDRDGHPFVTAEVTRETLSELRLSALQLMYRQLGLLATALPLSSHFQKPSEELLSLICELTKQLGSSGEAIIERYSEEPWRQCVLLLQRMLPLQLNLGERSSIDPSADRLQNPAELKNGLSVLIRSLEAVSADRLVRDTVWPVLRILEVFGFHLAHLDIRQNSAFHDRAVMQILQASGVTEAESFLSWSEEQRLTFFRNELASEVSRFKKHHHEQLGTEAQSVLGCYEILRDHINKYDPVGLGSLIVSMTRKLSDLLAVVFLAREGGITHWNGSTHYSLLPIVPLFETREDLEGAAELLSIYLCEPSTLSTLQHQKKEGQKQLIQEIMIGYSDSNKDCGIMASQSALHAAQSGMSKVAHSLNIGLRFFHGRGGTISRGAGPTHLFLDALPSGSLQGDLRMTEQGETIAQKYADPSTATYHLELLIAGVTGVSMAGPTCRKKSSLCSKKASSFLAEESRLAYQKLINTKDFITFYEQATPIDALEATLIGSRPKRRTSQRSLADLRAIPWVFSWNQSRFFLPGWFGVGSALQALEKKRPELFQELIFHHRSWSFLNYVLSNVETNLASAHFEIMSRYAALVRDPIVHDHVFSIIAEEFKKTKWQLQNVFGSSFEERRPRMEKTLALRDKALTLLHEQQIITLQAWREAQENDPAQAGTLLPRVLLSVNAIASGLRTTG
ncbi:MAG: phosphoenolpyruvate carboxylase [Chthoniobacterales bacterium]